MKVLILSANTGTGHNSVAQAVAERFEEAGDECVIRDCLEFVSPAVSKMISTGHTVMYKYFPYFNKLGWKMVVDHRASLNEDNPIQKIFRLGSNNLAIYLLNEKYDVVICTHIFAGWMLGYTVDIYNIKVRTGIIETDYSASPGCEYVNVDYHFLPTKEVAELAKELGIPEEKIIITGIPVKKTIYDKMPMEEAKSRLNISRDRNHIIVMCGSMGGGPLARITHHLIKKMGNEVYITVICGSNKNLYRDLKLAYGLRKNVRITKFIKEISLWMDSADLFITKPGGISTTEAAVKNLPMVLINSVGGCENGNLEYYVRKGGALCGSNPEDVASICRTLLGNSKQCENMREALREISSKNDTEIIVNTFKEAKAGAG